MLINAKPKNEELKASYFLQLGIGIWIVAHSKRKENENFQQLHFSRERK
jgi:hypothetical protein